MEDVFTTSQHFCKFHIIFIKVHTSDTLRDMEDISDTVKNEARMLCFMEQEEEINQAWNIS